MSAQEFTNLYEKKVYDESVTTFSNELGFSLIRLYPEDTPYYKDGKRMFIKVAVFDRGFFYSVDMTTPQEGDGVKEHVITDGGKYRKKVTGFMSDLSDGGDFYFDEVNKQVVHKKTNKNLSLNEFIDVLEGNHLADRLFWKRISSSILNFFLKFIFWLSSQHYDKVQVSIDKYHASQGRKVEFEEKIHNEPFFNYFCISKNFIFSILLATFLIAILVAMFPNRFPLKDLWHAFFEEFTLSNPMVTLLFFLGLFTSEKISIWLSGKIRSFLIPDQSLFSEPKKNFIEKLYNFQHVNKFDIRLDLRSRRN